jgi:hypothetical protein
MARGWESKSVESQQEPATHEPGARAASPLEREIAAKRRSLELSRLRVAHDLETAKSDVHRTALQNALRFLDY